MVSVNDIIRKRYVATGVAIGLPVRTRATPTAPPEPGGAPTADFSVATNSQLVAALMGDF